MAKAIEKFQPKRFLNLYLKKIKLYDGGSDGGVC